MAALIVRGDARGLGYMTWDVWRHVGGEAVLVDRCDPDFPIVLPWPNHIPRVTDVQAIYNYLVGDVVWSAETYYAPGLLARLVGEGRRCILHVNPELYDRDESVGAEIWLPTRWLSNRFDAEVVPMGVPFARPPRPVNDPPVILHVQGKPALGDRNGTAIACAIFRLLPQMRHVLATQAQAVPRCDAELRRSVLNRWALYEGCDVLLLPRRYGGLSMPVLEAMAAGVAVAMTDTPPNTDWPIIPLPVAHRGTIRTKAGIVPTADVDPVGAARMLASVDIAAAKARAHEWAAANTWDTWGPIWRMKLS